MLPSSIQKKFKKNIQDGLIRKNIVISSRDKNKIIIDNKIAINFCSNDYLGIATSEKIKIAFAAAAQKYGFGSGSSVAISGYFKIQQELEEKFAEFLQRDKAIFFNCGYLANLGVLTALTGKDNTIFADKFCHASILDGMQLAQAKHLRFRHNDIVHLNNLLEINKNALVITESVFSMSGKITPVAEIANIVKSNKAKLIIDDAHGIGILGNNGGGICEQLDLTQNQIECLITPLGKAFGGYGAIVSGSRELINIIEQFARSYRYTTALPPAICAANLEALDIIKNQQERRDKLNSLIEFFIEKAKKCNIPLISDDKTPIKCISVPDPVLLLKIQSDMLKLGFFISCIRPPTVPQNAARIRISLNCNHTEQQIQDLLEQLALLLNKNF